MVVWDQRRSLPVLPCPSQSSQWSFLLKTWNQFLAWGLLTMVMTLLRPQLRNVIFYILAGWWLSSLAATALHFIICIHNQEAMVLPETVPGTIYTMWVCFLHPGVGRSSWEGWLTSIQFSTGWVQQFPVVSRCLCFLNYVVGNLERRYWLWLESSKPLWGGHLST